MGLIFRLSRKGLQLHLSNQLTPPQKKLFLPKQKKKKNLKTRSKPVRVQKNLKKQNWLKYAGIVGFLILFLLVYFRKTIIDYIFEGEVFSVSLIQKVHAQELIPQKKKFLNSSVSIEKVNFIPSIGLDGFKVISSFPVEGLDCSHLENDIYQLAIILHPPEVINEKFLIRLRDCVLKLPEVHPLKKWMKWIGEPKKTDPTQQKKERIISEIVTSQFNLITDIKTKNEIIEVLNNIPENTISEELLKAYLYLMIGNVTRSDNILRKIINRPPRLNWIKTMRKNSFYHKLGKDHLSFIFKKLSKHPADRKSLELLSLYFQAFYTDSLLIKLSQDVNTDEVESSLNLKYTKLLAPELVSYLRLSRMKESDRPPALRTENSLTFLKQAYWIWPFFEMDAIISEKLIPTLTEIERKDELWFIYLMQNERLFDLYSKKSATGSLVGRRKFLRGKLRDDEVFMLSLYKLIELGDINQELVNLTMNFLINE